MSDTMWALTFDRERDGWDRSTGLVKERVPRPELINPERGRDRSQVIVKVHYAGFCGTDRGIWSRRSFGDMILGSLEAQGQDQRITGHELVGEIVDAGSRVEPKYGYRVGDVVSTESHIVCGTCYQCQHGEYHVCAREQIIGITLDGGFAEYVKLPAKALWPTRYDRIRPEVACMQEPFGNAVHACQVTDLSGKNVAILGTGTIGLFAVLVARALGAAKIIGVEPDPKHAELARTLGCDTVLSPAKPPEDAPWRSDPALLGPVHELTSGVGVDVALEMAGHNTSLNNAIKLTRRGGHVVLFGIRNGDAVFEDAHRIVMNGLQLHGVIGRRLFGTWEITRRLLESKDNGIQDAIWDHILRHGDDTIVGIGDWERGDWERRMKAHTKLAIRFG